MQSSASLTFLDHEARALLSRLDQVKPFSLAMPTVPAAAISSEALSRIESFLSDGSRDLRGKIYDYINWLRGSSGRPNSSAEAQRRFSILRLQFNNILSQLDIFADVLNQRSEHDTGVWLGGLDAVAMDALTIAGGYYEAPPVICYLDRGQGAAIRRARTRLPGGVPNPVAIIRVPRERMIGSGVASSLIHEVGHQGSALLDLVGSLRPILKGLQTGSERFVWQLWERWISEILADFWAVARIGVAATLGLIGVVSLPRVFVFRFSLDDPHPFPWIRVKLSCAIGQALYPDPQWQRLSRLWELLYPLSNIGARKTMIIASLRSALSAFVTLLANHRPRSLRGRSLSEALTAPRLQPSQLRALCDRWLLKPGEMAAASPTLVFAALGKARIDERLSPGQEGSFLSKLLKKWALKSTGNASAPVSLKFQMRGYVGG